MISEYPVLYVLLHFFLVIFQLYFSRHMEIKPFSLLFTL